MQSCVNALKKWTFEPLLKIMWYNWKLKNNFVVRLVCQLLFQIKNELSISHFFHGFSRTNMSVSVSKRQSVVNVHVKTNILIILLLLAPPSSSSHLFPALSWWKQRSDVLPFFSHVSKPQQRHMQPRTVGSEVQHKLQCCFSIFHSLTHTH